MSKFCIPKIIFHWFLNFIHVFIHGKVCPLFSSPIILLRNNFLLCTSVYHRHRLYSFLWVYEPADRIVFIEGPPFCRLRYCWFSSLSSFLQFYVLDVLSWCPLSSDEWELVEFIITINSAVGTIDKSSLYARKRYDIVAISVALVPTLRYHGIGKDKLCNPRQSAVLFCLYPMLFTRLILVFCVLK